MDLIALQQTLRHFAAERDWQPFHTPKNLSMALMVEAAELAEIFQWMTPEESVAAGEDAVVRERIADEVADVLLYLVQIADHTGVDIEGAVGRKMEKNAVKHPKVHDVPLSPELPHAPEPAAQIHVLVDWENVQPPEEEIRRLVPEATDVWLFHGPHQKKVDALYTSFGTRVKPIGVSRDGHNALDLQLSFHLGLLAVHEPNAHFVVVSNDGDYGPMLEYAGTVGCPARQLNFRKPSSKQETNQTPASLVKPGATKNATTKPTAQVASPIGALTKPTDKTPPTPSELQHVMDGLEKTTKKPRRVAALKAFIKSNLAQEATDTPLVLGTVDALQATGYLMSKDDGTVDYMH